MLTAAQRIPAQHRGCTEYLRKLLGDGYDLELPDVMVPGGLFVIVRSKESPGNIRLMFVRYVSGSWSLEEDGRNLTPKQREQFKSLSDRLTFSYLYPPPT